MGETYNATQIFAPAASFPVLVEVVQQQYEDDKYKHQTGRADEPPGPPRRLSALEKSHRLPEEACKAATTITEAL